MASCSRKRSVVTLEKKLEVIAMLKVKVMGIFKITDTTWSHAARISGVQLYMKIPCIEHNSLVPQTLILRNRAW